MSNSENEITEVKILNASDELFLYYKSLEEYEFVKNSLTPGTSAPIKVFSNIERRGDDLGLGIFAGANKKSLFIRN